MISSSTFNQPTNHSVLPSFGSNKGHAYVSKVTILNHTSGKLPDVNGEYFDIELSRSGFMTANAIEKAQQALIKAGFSLISGEKQYNFKIKRDLTSRTKEEIGKEVSNIIKEAKK